MAKKPTDQRQPTNERYLGLILTAIIGGVQMRLRPIFILTEIFRLLTWKGPLKALHSNFFSKANILKGTYANLTLWTQPCRHYYECHTSAIFGNIILKMLFKACETCGDRTLDSKIRGSNANLYSSRDVFGLMLFDVCSNDLVAKHIAGDSDLIYSAKYNSSQIAKQVIATLTQRDPIDQSAFMCIQSVLKISTNYITFCMHHYQMTASSVNILYSPIKLIIIYYLHSLDHISELEIQNIQFDLRLAYAWREQYLRVPIYDGSQSGQREALSYNIGLDRRPCSLPSYEAGSLLSKSHPPNSQQSSNGCYTIIYNSQWWIISGTPAKIAPRAQIQRRGCFFVRSQG